LIPSFSDQLFPRICYAYTAETAVMRYTHLSFNPPRDTPRAVSLPCFITAGTAVNFWRTGDRVGSGKGGGGFDTFSTDVKDEERNARQLSCTAAWIYRWDLVI